MKIQICNFDSCSHGRSHLVGFDHDETMLFIKTLIFHTETNLSFIVSGQYDNRQTNVEFELIRATNLFRCIRLFLLLFYIGTLCCNIRSTVGAQYNVWNVRILLRFGTIIQMWEFDASTFRKIFLTRIDLKKIWILFFIKCYYCYYHICRELHIKDTQ